MSKGSRIAVFVILVAVGIVWQSSLAMRCRCAWGEWSCHFIEGAFAFNVLWAGRTTVAAIRGRFFKDWLSVGLLVFTSPIWIPMLYKAWTAVVLLITTGSVGELGH